MRRTRDGRTARQIEADELDLELFRLANRLAASGYDAAARKHRLALFEMLHTIHDDDAEDLHPLAAEYGIPAAAN